MSLTAEHFTGKFQIMNSKKSYCLEEEKFVRATKVISRSYSSNGSFLNGPKVNPVFTTDDEKLEITRSHLSRWKKRRETGSRLHFMVSQV